MLLWFLIVAPVLVAEVFRSPVVDYRLVALGAVVPLVDVVVGSVSFLHSLLAPVAVLAVVMVATIPAGPIGSRLRSARLLRRRLLGLPIGMFFHLVLDGAWTSAPLFWWPVLGLGLDEVDVPEGTGVARRLLLEALALVVAVWAYRRYELDRPGNRRLLLTTGHLTRQSVS